MSPWLLLYLLLLPMAIWWYGVRARRLLRRVRSWVSRLRLRFHTALRSRLLSLLQEPTASESEEEALQATTLYPRP
jgi:hypothetical protein